MIQTHSFLFKIFPFILTLQKFYFTYFSLKWYTFLHIGFILRELSKKKLILTLNFHKICTYIFLTSNWAGYSNDQRRDIHVLSVTAEVLCISFVFYLFILFDVFLFIFKLYIIYYAQMAGTIERGHVPSCALHGQQDEAPSWEEIHAQFTEISRSRHAAEAETVIYSKGKNYEDFRDYYGKSNRYCSICSEATTHFRPYMKPVYHRHWSSKEYRVNAPLDSSGAYFCISCEKSPHRVQEGGRSPILISSSTLHSWQGDRARNGYKGDSLHVDSITIPGATISTLTHALIAEYGAGYRPIDVLAVFGLNDLLRGHSVHKIISDMQRFQEAVHRLSPPNDSSSVAIATIIIPPKLADLQFDFPGNRFHDIVELNYRIKNLNERQNRSRFNVRLAPQFHSWGLSSSKMRAPNPRYLMQRLPKHRNNQWREHDPEDKLHLDNATRLRMGKACIRYFSALYGITICRAPNKPLGLIMDKAAEEGAVQHNVPNNEDLVQQEAETSAVEEPKGGPEATTQNASKAVKPRKPDGPARASSFTAEEIARQKEVCRKMSALLRKIK